MHAAGYNIVGRAGMGLAYREAPPGRRAEANGKASARSAGMISALVTIGVYAFCGMLECPPRPVISIQNGPWPR